MMGSSGQQVALLDGILTLITNPDLVKKNILALQEKIKAAEDAMALAREQQAEAKKATIDAGKAQEDLKPKLDVISKAEAELDAKRAALEADLAAHKNEHTTLTVAWDGYREAERTLTEREKAVKAKEDGHVAVLTKATAELKKREEALIKREENVKAGETKNAEEKADLDNRVSEVNKLLGRK